MWEDYVLFEMQFDVPIDNVEYFEWAKIETKLEYPKEPHNEWGNLKFDEWAMRNMKLNPISKYLRSWSLCPKPNLVVYFWALLVLFGRPHLDYFLLEYSTQH